MPKILYITARSDYGGGPEQMHLLIKGLSADFKVYVACPNDVPYFAIFGRYAECMEIPHRRFSVSALVHLYRAVKKNDIDIIHSHGRGGGVYARLLGAMTRRPVVHTFQGVHLWHLSPLKKFFYLFVEKSLALVTDVFINVSESERATCENANFYSEKFKVVPIGVEVQPIRRLAAGSGTFTLITISRLSFEKGVDVLFKVVKALAESGVDFKLLIVGNGPERERLETDVKAMVIEKYVVFLGAVSDAEKLKWLDSAHVFMNTSRCEGMPIAVLEAMARSLPVVATDVAGNKDVVISWENGFLFDITRPEEGARRIVELMENPALYEAVSKGAHRTMIEKFSVEMMCESTKDIYMSLLGAAQKKSPMQDSVLGQGRRGNWHGRLNSAVMQWADGLLR